MTLQKKMLCVAVLAAVALLSVLVCARWAQAPETYAKTIQELEEKRDTVMDLTAAATAASVGVTLIPGDVAMPLAEKLADVSSCFVLVLSVIYLEKYLLTIIGYIVFSYLVPALCICIGCSLFFGGEKLKRLTAKLAILSIVMLLIIPFSVRVSALIETTYEDSIAQTLSAAQDTGEAVPEQTEEEQKEEGFLSGLVSTVTEGVSSVVSGGVEAFETYLNQLFEALAIMIVTSCVIPVLSLLLFLWLGNSVLGLNISLPKKSAVFSRT